MLETVSSPTKEKTAIQGDLPRLFYRPSQVCKVTGDSLSTVMRAIYAAELEAYQRGRLWFVPVDAVDRWVRGD